MVVSLDIESKRLKMLTLKVFSNFHVLFHWFLKIHLYEPYNYTHCMLKLNTLPPPCKTVISIAYARVT